MVTLGIAHDCTDHSDRFHRKIVKYHETTDHCDRFHRKIVNYHYGSLTPGTCYYQQMRQQQHFVQTFAFWHLLVSSIAHVVTIPKVDYEQH
eukprot:1132498-Rhodomonas_salina.3